MSNRRAGEAKRIRGTREGLFAPAGEPQKLFQEMARHRATVLALGTDVVDGREITLERGDGALYDGRGELLVEQHFLGGARAQRDRRHAAVGEPHLLDQALAIETQETRK